MDKRTLLVVMGLSTTFYMAILFYVTFLMAFFNGYKVSVYCNVVNEALFEFFLFPLFILLGGYSIWQSCKAMGVKVKRKQGDD